MRDWLELLRALGADSVEVKHTPLTERYQRAAKNRHYILRNATVLGERAITLPHTFEVALWCPHPEGARRPGYYVCIRVRIQGKDLVTDAILFCFYDGTDGKPGFRSCEKASTYAHDQGFGGPSP